jgi:hypothetical protein
MRVSYSRIKANESSMRTFTPAAPGDLRRGDDLCLHHVAGASRHDVEVAAVPNGRDSRAR